MKKRRLIPRLDVKGPNVVKGIQLEGLRIVGDPAQLARKYYEQGADEILYIDIVASLYERNNLMDIVHKTTSSGIYIPITVGGGIRSIDDVKLLLRAGADKVAINTAATRNPELIIKAAKMFGSQCIVGSIEAKLIGERWEAYIDNGREKTGLDAIEWAKKLVELGAGELLVTSVDRDGTKRGFDTELIRKITGIVDVPVIACGGAGSADDVVACLQDTECDAVSFGTVLHYKNTTISKVKELLQNKGIEIRQCHELVNEENNLHKKKQVSIIDYGAGNLMSVVNAFKAMGNPVEIVSSENDIRKADLLVLPGDGAFGYAMETLNNSGMADAVRDYILTGKPFFGICLGMQLLLNKSEEFGIHDGLGIIKGDVRRLKSKSIVDDPYYRIPHMGWNKIIKPRGKDWSKTPLHKANGESEVYFVHSYCVYPNDQQDVLAFTEYGGQKFCTILKRDNIFATQFHPEKSGSIGIEMVRYFSNL